MRKTIFETEVSFYNSVREPAGEARRLASLLLSKNKKWRTRVEAVRNETDPEKRKELKQSLPAFTVSGLFNGRKELQAHSGYICIDIDAKDNDGVTNFEELKSLICQVPCVEYCGQSVGGAGYFCIIPIADPDKHGLYFQSLRHNFKRCGLTIDRQCGNINRMRFVSYDPAPYINTAAEVYDYILPVRGDKTRNAGEVTDEVTQRFVSALGEIDESHTDITGNYGQWFEILCSIAGAFGDDGREYAHRVSQWAGSYTAVETDKVYDECLRHGGYGYSLGTFYYYAKKEIGRNDFLELLEQDKL